MGTTRNDDGSEVPAERRSSDALYLIGTMADTTWRMFVPTIGLAFLGNLLDRQMQMKPWLMLLGFTIGACIAGLLIKRQLAKGKSRNA